MGARHVPRKASRRINSFDPSNHHTRVKGVVMFAKLSYTWDLMRSSWDVLKRDKELILFPLFSGIACLLVMASFVVPLIVTDAWRPPAGAETTAHKIAYYAVLFAFYFCTYFVITFFNTAIIASAVRRMEGGEPTLGTGFADAFSRIHLVAGWALVSATVGLILRIIEERSEKVGRFVAGLLGMAWTVTTYLVVPVLAVERKGPFDALKQSASMLRRTWGEQIVGNFSFGLVFFLLSLPAFAIGALGLVLGGKVVIVTCIALAVVYLVILALVQSTLQSIFQAAVYLYASGQPARQQMATHGFPVQLIDRAMAVKA
jgi:hypothetical protein